MSRTAMQFVCLLLALGLLFVGQAAKAGTYEISVTRKGGNAYRVDGKRVTILTRYCHVYAYSEQALLRSNGYGGELIFIDSRDKCDVKAVYAASDPAPGKYAVHVIHESDNWYEIQGTDLYLQTSMCLSLALGQMAFLTLNPGGYGTLVFEDGQSCMVEGVQTKIKLD